MEGDGHTYKDGSMQYSTNSFILSAGLDYLYRSLGKNTKHFNRKDKPTIITTKVNVTKKLSKKIGINKIISYNDYEGDVYDICTEDGTFVGGVGEVLFKNTDQYYPKDLIERFLKYDLDLVVPVTYRRKETSLPIHYKKLLRGNKFKDKSNAPDLKEGLVQVEGSTVAGALIKTEVFSKIKFPWFFQTEKLEEIDGNEILCGDGGDVYFCRKLKKAGIKIFVDTSVSSPHEVKAFCERGEVLLG